MTPEPQPPSAGLTGLVEVTRLVRELHDVPRLLDGLASVISRSLGFGTVVIVLYRDAWDDFELTTVHGSATARAALLGGVYCWSDIDTLLDERFLRRGAYVVRAGEAPWPPGVAHYTPTIVPSVEPDAWQPEDGLNVPLIGSDGRVMGLIGVDEPHSGRRPSDADLDVLVAYAEQTALALELAAERSRADEHRAALDQLMRISARLTDTLSTREILEEVCEGIQAALGFENVSVDLVEPDTGRVRPRAARGWALSEPALSAVVGLREIEPLLDPQFEIEGCFLLPSAAARARTGTDCPSYVSTMNGAGPHAWDCHWLLVPLYDRAGDLTGVIWADEPRDRLLPSAERLRALRVFANQAAAALEVTARYDEARFMAEHDALTGLANRRVLSDRLVTEIARSRRTGRPFALVVFDLDDFKSLNDTLGHAAGDRALTDVAAALRERLRAVDCACRVGGDEFAVLMPETDDAGAIDATARLRAALARGELPLAASFGVAVSNGGADGPETLLRRADHAMYAEKLARPRRAA